MEVQNRSRDEGDKVSEMLRDDEAVMNMEDNVLIGDVAEEESQKKRFRHRRRKIYQNIRSKMEFYFSDANLAKDRFLSQLIEKNPEIDLAVFLRFNKIRELTDNMEDIKNSLKHSELLTVTEDGARVFRTKPIQLKDNEDDCTIYVEKLPPEANHDWLMQVFSQHGVVDYVSIPKYRSTGKIKGFAFVEFHTPEEAQKTLEAFGAVGCCLSSNIEPEKLCSVITFENEGNDTDVPGGNWESRGQDEPAKTRDALDKEASVVEVVTLDEQAGENQKSKKAKKREKQKLKSTEEESVKKDGKRGKRKRKRTDDSDKTDEREDDSSDRDEKKVKTKNVVANVGEQEDLASKDEKETGEEEKPAEVTGKSDDEEEDVTGKDEKKVKRKRKHSAVADKTDEEEDVSVKGKREKLGEELEQEMSSPETEKSSKRKRQEEAATSEEIVDVPEKKARMDGDVEKEQDDAGTDDWGVVHKKTRHRKKKKRRQITQEVSALGLQVLSKKEWKRLRNKYLNLQKLTMKNLKQQLFRARNWNMRGGHANGHSQRGEQANKVPNGNVSNKDTTAARYSYAPGVIVHVRLDDPVTDVKNFKAQAKSCGDVQYVDVQVDATEAFLRCTTAEAAKQLLSAKPWPEMAVLEGEEDKQYWARIDEDRESMVKVQKKKKRGKDKLLARAEKALSKHIKFDETLQ